MIKYFCDCEHCKNATWSTLGDGWNEPMESEMDCSAIEDMDDEFTDDPNDELCPKFLKIEGIKNIQELADELGTNIKGIEKAIYKGTECGAWIQIEEDGIKLGSIVEGVNGGTNTYTLLYPFDIKRFWGTLESIEHEAQEIWNNTHGCPYCWILEGIEINEEEELEEYKPVDPDCKHCNGKGIIL